MAVPVQKLREIVFQMLYSTDLGRSTDENMLDLLTKELAVTKKVVKDVQARVHLIREQIKEIDALIAKTSKSYEFERIQSVERNILRLGAFELLYDSTIPPKVAIAEALRLARKFSTKESASFINAILDAIYKSSIGEKFDPKVLAQSAKQLTEIEAISHEAALEQKKDDDTDTV